MTTRCKTGTTKPRASTRALAILVGPALAVAGLLAISPGADAASRPRAEAVDVVVRIKDLDRQRRHLEISWLAGRTVHTADGRTVDLPWSKHGARERSLRLLGHTSQGWLVKDFTGDTWNVWLARHSDRALLSQHAVSEGDIVDITPSGDRQRYAVHYYSGDPAENLVGVRDLSGDLVASRLFPNDAAVLGFSGPEAVIGTAETQRWDVDEDTIAPLGRDALAADLAHDVAFVADPATNEFGPTSLSDPEDPEWSARMREVAVSPDGLHVLTRPARGSRVIEVRSLATGEMVKSFRILHPNGDAPRWETDRSFVFLGSPGSLGDREVLARCTLGGRCSAATGRTPRDTISLPVG